MARCSALTRKGKPCPIDADRLNGGKPVCHVHDQGGIRQQQIRANREDRRQAKRRARG